MQVTNIGSYFATSLEWYADLEAVAQTCSVKKVFLEVSQNSQENACARVSFLVKLCRPQACNFIKKETLAQVFSCEFCEISKNTFSYRTPLVAASADPNDAENSERKLRCYNNFSKIDKNVYCNSSVLAL